MLCCRKLVCRETGRYRRLQYQKGKKSHSCTEIFIKICLNHFKENLNLLFTTRWINKTSCFTQQLEICSLMKLYRPNNFKCPVTQQNWFHMVTEHTIHPNNFKVTSHIPTTLFSKIPSALSVISVLLQKRCWNGHSLPPSGQDFYFPFKTWGSEAEPEGLAPGSWRQKMPGSL